MALLGAGGVTGPWTPANLAVAPIAWIHAPNAVWSGSNLSSLSGFTVNGTPTKGTVQNSIDPIRFDATTEGLSKSLTLTSGVVSYFFIGARLATTGICCLFARSWGQTGGVGGYIATSDGTQFSANGWHGLAFHADNPPWMDLSSNVVGDTSWHSQAGLLSAAAATLWKDGVSQAIEFSLTGAVPSYSSATWTFARNDTTETANSDIGALLLFDYAPTTDERQKLEGYYHHLFDIEANLDAGHPYKAAPP